MKHRRILIGLTLLAVLILLNLPMAASLRLKAHVRDNLAPFQNGIALAMAALREAAAAAGEAAQVGRERRDLREQNTRLKYEIQRLQALEQENTRLRALLGFRDRYRHELVLAEVVARGDISGWWQTIRLNRGREAGIEADRAVITDGALVGRTTTVSLHTADVLLITDPGSRVACRLPRTGALGVLFGRGVSMTGDRALEMLYAVRPSRMEFVDRSADVRVGDEVATSGLGGVFPEGLLVGHVSDVDLDPTGLYQRVEVQPAADLSALRHAFVVCRQKREGDRDR